ncbi:hypothetical protein [Paenibacillus antarcticus]|uniref:Uncharacterized protein n=1 Tax=Paenibacillus antarcticus TaxID=253703 RepID=A0A168PA96_9BACL|nr:hypothetical protein [Paenibacillus antarcticus]OAB46560.1 hypothetical protein PBAT_11125 [Paenibacillus antarcticus]
MENRDWQKDMEYLDNLHETNGSVQIAEYWLQQYKQEANEACYWKGEVSVEKEKSAYWICKYNAAEQKYLTQSNVIAELRVRAESAEALHKEWKEAYWSLHAKYTALYPLDREENGNV